MTGRPRIIGHRGASAERPENTLEGIAHALSAGADGVEIDVHITADGAVVVTHDFTLNPDIARGPDARPVAPGHRIHAMTRADLAAIDVGQGRQASRFAATFPDQRPVPGARIPLLADVLNLCAAASPTPQLLIEVKSNPTDSKLAAAARRCIDAVCDMLGNHPMASRSVIQCFDWAILAQAAKIAPWLPRSYLTMEAGKTATAYPGSPWCDGADWPIAQAIAARGGAAWALHHRDVTAASVANGRAAGLMVFAWTVNGPQDIAAMVKMGVDAIITDGPTAALGCVARRA